MSARRGLTPAALARRRRAPGAGGAGGGRPAAPPRRPDRPPHRRRAAADRAGRGRSAPPSSCRRCGPTTTRAPTSATWRPSAGRPARYLDRRLKARHRPRRPAIVLDVDETSLSNYAGLASSGFAATGTTIDVVSGTGTPHRADAQALRPRRAGATSRVVLRHGPPTARARGIAEPPRRGLRAGRASSELAALRTGALTSSPQRRPGSALGGHDESRADGRRATASPAAIARARPSWCRPPRGTAWPALLMEDDPGRIAAEIEQLPARGRGDDACEVRPAAAPSSSARIFGIRIGASPSWFFVLFLLIYLLRATSATCWTAPTPRPSCVAVAGALLFFASLVAARARPRAGRAPQRRSPIAGIDLWFFGGAREARRATPTRPGAEFRDRRRRARGDARGHRWSAWPPACWPRRRARVARRRDAPGTERHAGARAARLPGGINALLLVVQPHPRLPARRRPDRAAAAWKATGDRNRGTRFSGAPGPGLRLRAHRLRHRAGAPRRRCSTALWFMVLGWFLARRARGAVAASASRSASRASPSPTSWTPRRWRCPADVPRARGRRTSASCATAGRGSPSSTTRGAFVGLLRARPRRRRARAPGSPTLSVGELVDGATPPSASPRDAAARRAAGLRPLRALGRADGRGPRRACCAAWSPSSRSGAALAASA